MANEILFSFARAPIPHDGKLQRSVKPSAKSSILQSRRPKCVFPTFKEVHLGHTEKVCVPELGPHSQTKSILQKVLQILQSNAAYITGILYKI